MSIYAKINKENIVENVILCDDEDIKTQFGNHIKVTEDTNAAGEGFEYNSIKNKFIGFQPYPSWVLNETTCLWEAPVAKPENAGPWNESTQSWVVSE